MALRLTSRLGQRTGSKERGGLPLCKFRLEHRDHSATRIQYQANSFAEAFPCKCAFGPTSISTNPQWRMSRTMLSSATFTFLKLRDIQRETTHDFGTDGQRT